MIIPRKEYISIKDRSTREIVTQGPVVSRKIDPEDLVSVDNVVFFKRNGSKSYSCTIQNTFLDTVIKSNIPYSTSSYRNRDIEAEVYVERSFIDEEVKPLVYALNAVQGIETTGSCSGHGYSNLWVAFLASEIQGLAIITNVIESHRDIHLTTNNAACSLVIKNGQVSYGNLQKVYLSLVTNNIGKTAFDLAKVISKEIYNKALEFGLVEEFTKDKYGFPRKY